MVNVIGLLLSLSTSTLAVPNPKHFEKVQPLRRDVNQDFHDYQADSFAYSIQISCGDKRRENIINGIAEAGFLANQLWQTTPSSKYKGNLDTYFGSNAATSYDQLLKTPIGNEYNLHKGKISPNDHNIYIVCNPEEETITPCERNIGGKTSSIGKDAMIVVCPRYHSQPSLGNLLQKQREGASVTATKLWSSKAGIILHETFHIEPWIASRGTSDYEDQRRNDPSKLIYGPAKVKDLARRRNV